jgi:hypothetical protein
MRSDRRALSVQGLFEAREALPHIKENKVYNLRGQTISSGDEACGRKSRACLGLLHTTIRTPSQPCQVAIPAPQVQLKNNFMARLKNECPKMADLSCTICPYLLGY